MLLLGYQSSQLVGMLGPRSPVVAQALMLAFLPLAWLVAKGLHLRVGDAYALEWSRRAAGLLATCLALAALAKLAALATGLGLGVYVRGPGAPGGASALAAALPWLAISTFVPSLAEDVLTRGFWMRVTPIRWTGTTFAIVTSTVYVLNHGPRLGLGPAEWAMLLAFGLAYAAAAWRSGTLWAAVGLHWGWNLAGPAIDAAMPFDVAQPDASRLLSAAAHLALLGVVVAWPRRSRPR